MTRPLHEFELVERLVAAGMNDCSISRETGIPRGTVRDWRRGKRRSQDPYAKDAGRDCSGGHDFTDLPSAEYSYALGMYLGDGYVSRSRRGVFRLRISCDSIYPAIIDECCWALEALFPSKHATLVQAKGRCVVISMWSKHWPCLFPQHGVGRKHERPIILEPWQEEHVKQATESFVRGLIHSDGCRVVANDRGVKSVRYHFSNRSEDIKGLFCAALDSLDIPWTRPSDRDIAIYRKAAVARLDQFVGPKR